MSYLHFVMDLMLNLQFRYEIFDNICRVFIEYGLVVVCVGCMWVESK